MTFPSRRRLIRRISSVFGRAVRKIPFLSGAGSVNTPNLPPETRGNQERRRKIIHEKNVKRRLETEREVVREVFAEEDEELKDIENGHHI